MTVGELTDILLQVDRNRMVYVPDPVTTEPRIINLATCVVDLQHMAGIEGIAIPDDVVLLPLSMTDLMTEQTEVA